MDHASLVFCRCVCTSIVFLIFCNVFNWWLCLTLLTYILPFIQTFCLDIGSVMTCILVVIWVDISMTSALILTPTCAHYYALAGTEGAVSFAFVGPSVCPSVAYIANNSRNRRPVIVWHIFRPFSYHFCTVHQTHMQYSNEGPQHCNGAQFSKIAF